MSCHPIWRPHLPSWLEFLLMRCSEAALLLFRNDAALFRPIIVLPDFFLPPE